MIGPARPEALDRLRRSAGRGDRDLDAALLRLGVLPPLDLEPIRRWLDAEGVRLVAASNADGHRIIEFVIANRVAARVHHDGTVVVDHPPSALASA